jgi:hypothetical protein
LKFFWLDKKGNRMPLPASSSLTIQDLIPKVQAALQNRPDVNESDSNPEMRPSAWIRDTLREITAKYPFSELQIVGPLQTIGPGLGFQGSNYMYPVSMFLKSGDDMTLSEDPVIFLTTAQALSVGLVATTTNVSAYSMDYLTPKAIQTLLFQPGGVPYKYTRYADMFWFGSQPGQNYNVYLPYQVRHPFIDGNLPASPIRISTDWLDIVAYAAAERGAITKRWNDQATFLHNTLYGDPDFQMSGGVEGRPGLIAGRTLQSERDRRLSPVMITIGSARY